MFLFVCVGGGGGVTIGERDDGQHQNGFVFRSGYRKVIEYRLAQLKKVRRRREKRRLGRSSAISIRAAIRWNVSCF